ncbi:MAG: ABC transporter permease, partial [Tannerellaceae bacterium]|nr:ABC transporter permease [Tannerellaceae bacterium]
MKTITRNFLSVLRRFKMATVLNLLGLTVAFAAFMVILIQVKYEYSYDRTYSTADRIYRVDKTVENIIGMVQTRPFIEEFVKSSPHIEAGGLILALPISNYFYVTHQGEKKGFREAVSIIQPEIVKVFDFPVLQGDPDCLNDPEKMMIPESLAQKIFGDESPIGKSVQTDEQVFYKNEKMFTVGAVYRDFP